ncbi:hypothetical protein J7E73_29215 [Paenibacillus albidus]|uniref:hypothetical protein n=1 Tax=Paenibacillus albidus TaxID=2041023 RepID=UPI001BE97D2D|nr:hypothetical protein [Paenibacillus albidus]MBT2293122.1 hypothetical protein [Paenibacillus albidus]
MTCSKKRVTKQAGKSAAADTDLVEQTPEQLQQELVSCREQARIAPGRYEFIYAEEMSQRIRIIKKHLLAQSKQSMGGH